MQVLVNKSLEKIVLLGTGGTIAGLASNNQDTVGYTAALLGVDQLIRSLPQPFKFPYGLVSEQIAQVDSKDMCFDVWSRLAQRCEALMAQPDVRGIVITHGTDTLEETAYFLHAVLTRSDRCCKPVVLTGAMRPASALMPDGLQNMLDALTVAAHPGASGVLVVFAGTIHAALDVKKSHTYRLDAFDSGEAGALGYVEAGSIRMVRGAWPGDSGEAAPENAIPATKARWPRVEIIMSYAGAGASMVDGLLSHGLASNDPVRGIVVAGTGNGSVHQALESALLRAQTQGVVVVRATRCAGGRVLAGSSDTLPDSAGLSPVKARIALMLRLIAADPTG
ncbi:MAG: asparaginase [Rhodoferax sp.]|nr:asparaginase [Rhodoferax sp.]